jgi:iron complex transport system ATP-binding protein
MTRGLQAENIIYAVGNRRILDGVAADITPGRVVAVVGPNGAGKSTLLKILAGDTPPQIGTVLLNGRPLTAWNRGDLARQRAVLPQSPELAFHFRVREVVELGRHPYSGCASPDDDRRAIEDAMSATEIGPLAMRDCSTLSGGERHRTHYARVLAQLWRKPEAGETRILLLDEPTAGLDLFHQHAILAKARAMAKDGIGVLAVLHDLNLAAAYADTLIVLVKGRIDAAGPPRDVLTPDRIKRVWRVDCDVITDDGGRRHVQVHPIGVPIAAT